MVEDEKRQGEIKKFNASKEIAQQRDVKLMLAHSLAIRQARTGETPIKSLYEMGDNERTLNKVKGLSLTIHAQKDLILISRALTRSKSINQWHKEVKKEERLEKPFEEHDNDYNRLLWLSQKLGACEMDLQEARRTKSVEDDFMIIKQGREGEEFILTENHTDMLKELEDSYEEIEGIMYRNGVITSDLVEDEEKTTKELEEEMIKRVVEA